LRIALDGTEWHHDLKMLVASVIVGRRAIPVQVAAFRKTPIFRSQNGWEHTFLRPRETGRTAVLLGDRGFHRVSGFQLLLERKPSFVVRRVAEEPTRAGSSTPGRRSTSGRTRPSGSGSSGSGPQGRRNPGRPDPLADLVALYDRRMGLGIPRAAASA
jgi:hypothetical protein